MKFNLECSSQRQRDDFDAGGGAISNRLSVSLSVMRIFYLIFCVNHDLILSQFIARIFNPSKKMKK